MSQFNLENVTKYTKKIDKEVLYSILYMTVFLYITIHNHDNCCVLCIRALTRHGHSSRIFFFSSPGEGIYRNDDD